MIMIMIIAARHERNGDGGIFHQYFCAMTRADAINEVDDTFGFWGGCGMKYDVFLRIIYEELI